VIVVAVRWYLLYGLSYRDVEGLGMTPLARCGLRGSVAFADRKIKAGLPG
jgi:hypothetical protein